MSAAFTPGPWGTHFHPSHGHCITQVNEHGKPKSGDIAVVFMAGNGRTREQCKADAVLISTVPEMLDALQRTAEKCEAYADWIKRNVMSANIEEHPYLPELEGDAEDARAVIAKATGGAA